MNKSEMVIVTAFDQSYANRGKALIESVLTNTPYNIIALVINAPDEIVAVDPRVLHITHTEKFKSEEWKRHRCANIRVWLLSEALLRYGYQKALWLDADSIVRGSICEIETLLDRFDTVAVKTPEFTEKENQYLISTVGVSRRAWGNYFLLKWADFLEQITDRKGPSIMHVQLAYKQTLDLNTFRFFDLTYEYSDKFFREFTPIWEAQGIRKFKDETYLKEEALYLARFSEREARRWKE